MRTHKRFTICLILLVTSAVFVVSCEQNPEQEVLKAEIGKPAPNFKLKDTKGKTWELSDLKGKVVFVNFWATWCPPCREELPSMQALYQSMPREKFEMLSILNNDDPVMAQALVDKMGGTFPVLDDPDTYIGNIYGLTGIPETFIIDPQGVLREKFIGPRPWNSPAARNMLRRYLP